MLILETLKQVFKGFLKLIFRGKFKKYSFSLYSRTKCKCL